MNLNPVYPDIQNILVQTEEECAREIVLSVNIPAEQIPSQAQNDGAGFLCNCPINRP